MVSCLTDEFADAWFRSPTAPDVVMVAQFLDRRSSLRGGRDDVWRPLAEARAASSRDLPKEPLALYVTHPVDRMGASCGELP